MSKAAKYQAALPILALALVGCGSASEPRTTGTGGEEISTGGAGGSGTGGATKPSSNGGTVGTGGASAADASTGTVADAEARAGTGGASGGDAGVSADVGGSSAGGFTCNQLVGPSPMFQWFNGGFLKQPGIDPTKWQLISVAHHYTDAWAKPGDSAWNSALDGGHACADGSKTPDRVIFQATQWSHTTAAQWITDLTGIVDNIKTKWPGVKRIELMASTSAPGNMPCPAAGGKNNETIVPSIGYEAIDAMPAKFPGLVVALPHFEVACKDFIGNGTAPQYAPTATATTGAAVLDVATIFAAYWAMHP
jgi:hypothetical protein